MSKKITDLTAATTPLAGTELVEIVQSGTSKKVAASYLSGSGGGREVLTAARTYYVRTDGSDSNDGLANTSGGAFLTIQKAINAALLIDAAIYQVTVKIADGTYNESVILGQMIGSNKLIIEGNTTTPANVVVNGETCFLGDTGVYALIKGVKTQGSGIGIYARYGGVIEFETIDFGAVTSRHLGAAYGGHLVNLGNASITGASNYHIYLDGTSSYVQLGTITITGTPAFTTFAYASGGAQYLKGGGASYSGSATGTRYSATLNAVINTAGGGASFFPGDVAGTTATGGQYA